MTAKQRIIAPRAVEPIVVIVALQRVVMVAAIKHIITNPT